MKRNTKTQSILQWKCGLKTSGKKELLIRSLEKQINFEEGVVFREVFS